MESQSAILLRRLNPYCARRWKAQPVCARPVIMRKFYLNTGCSNCWSRERVILPVLSQQLLTHMAARQKPVSLTLSWHEEKGVGMEFGYDE